VAVACVCVCSLADLHGIWVGLFSSSGFADFVRTSVRI